MKKSEALKEAIAIALKQADAQLMLGRGAEAMQIYRALLAKSPSQPTALYNLGMLHHRRHELREAEDYLRRALRAMPQDPETMMALALVCSDLGLAEEAQNLMQNAVDLSPTGRILTKAGAFQLECGNVTAARAMYERATAADPTNIDAYFALATLQKLSPSDPLLVRLETLHQNATSLPDIQRCKLEFALGKAHLDTGQDAVGFAHYATANRLKRLGYKKFSIARLESYVESIIQLFSAEVVAKFRNTGTETSSRPIFIVGMPRSGSTLVEQILASHPAVSSIGESPFLHQSMPVFTNAEVPDYFPSGTPSITRNMLDGLSEEMLATIDRKYLHLTEPRAAGCARLADKMLFNFFWIGLIRLALPSAAIIHCTRDPMSIGLSIWQASFSTAIPWAYDQIEIARYYRAYEKLMAHWNRLFPGEICNVNYETLVRDQEDQTRRILQHCDLPWDDKCMRFHENGRNVATSSVLQVRRGLHDASINRWKKYETYLQPMIQALKEYA